jgi:putative ATP-binding cassette transporter
VIFPYVVAGPRFFAGAITLGVLMQVADAFRQVQVSLSFFITNYSFLAEWRAVINRLRGFEVAIDEVSGPQAGPTIVSTPGSEAVTTRDLDLVLPTGRRLAEDIDLEFRKGERVLIRGASGSGKSTLFRAISGIWPYGGGTVSMPANARVLFLPQ